ncbi:MAG: thiamine pyrophosphate-binding protein [Bacteriovoracaceae bacterium]
MNKTGAELVVYALEQIGVKYTFGIPGVHNVEIYDQLNSSSKITPMLVTHELAGAFMADAISRTADSSQEIGAMVIVPAAGTTHAASGIGEAFLDGIPMMVISGGTRRDSGRSFQLHQLDQEKIIGGLVKKFYLVTDHNSIIQTIYDAYELATSGTPGPVFIEVPADIQMFSGAVTELRPYSPKIERSKIESSELAKIKKLLTEAKQVGIYAGWGAKEASAELINLAEKLNAPVATTMQGLSVFPANHPLHSGFGFGVSAVPAAFNAFKACDVMVVIGARFSELATGSFGVNPPEKLIHIDINPAVFNKNYPATVTVAMDAKLAVTQILEELQNFKIPVNNELLAKIAQDKKEYFATWTETLNNKRVSPGYFFKYLREQLSPDGFVVADDGNHTFLTAELMPILKSKNFISPTDYNAMGYAVPAAIATKLSHPDKEVVAIVGDGAFLMTGLELITAKAYELGVIIFVFSDGELGQISKLQLTPLNRKTCTVLNAVDLSGIAKASGANYLTIENDLEIEARVKEAFALTKKRQPVLVNVNISYEKQTQFTKGVIKTNLAVSVL